MTKKEMKQAFYEAGKEKGYTWMLSGKPGEMKAHCSHCGGAAPTDENGKTKLTDLCPHCGERLLPEEKPREQRMWWDEDYDPDVDDPLKDLITPSTLIPGDPDGSCLGNGSHEGYRFMCHECPYGETCAPELQ